MSLSVIILAAGKGTRMKSKLPKVLQPLAGKSLLWHVIAAAKAVAADNIITIYGYKGDQVKAQFADESIIWVEQAEQLGTGHAVQVALSDIPRTGQSIILYGDVPLIQPKTLKRLLEVNTGEDNRNLSMITLNVENPFGLGRIVRDDNDRVSAIVEEKDANEYQRHITEVNTGIYCIDNMLLHELLPNLSNQNAQQEYYLTDIVKMAADTNSVINTIAPKLAFETDGVNNKVQLAGLERKWQSHLAGELMTQGVTMTDPERVEIRGTIRCGQDVSIDTGVIFSGDCVIEDDVRIDAGCIISDSHIEAGAHIKPYCVIDQSHIGKHASIGPFAHLRPSTQLGDDVKIGNFVETKKSHIATGSKVNHLSYVGDAEIGEGVNIGAGTITCNYDGANKHKTTIGDHVFIGSNSSLVAPVTIGAGSTVGAGSTITKDVAKNALAVGRGKQVQKDNYVRPQK